MNERPTPSPPAVTPSELAESLRRAGLSRLNPGQQADFREGLVAVSVLAGRMPRDVSLFQPFAFDFLPGLHAPPPPKPAPVAARKPVATKAAAKKPAPKALAKAPPRKAKPAKPAAKPKRRR